MTGSLYAQVYDWDNLLLAHRRASKGKRGKEPAARFDYHLEDNLIALHDELRSRTYRPGTYHSFYIHEPKQRLISAAPFRDRNVGFRCVVAHDFPSAGNARRLRLSGRGLKAGAVRSWPRPAPHSARRASGGVGPGT